MQEFLKSSSSRPTARVLSATPSRFLMNEWSPIRTTLCAWARSLAGIELFFEYNFLRAIYFKQKRTAMNEMNKKTRESHECKRQGRVQKEREQRRTTLACEKERARPAKATREKALTSPWSAKTWAKSSRAEEICQEAQKGLNAQKVEYFDDVLYVIDLINCLRGSTLSLLPSLADIIPVQTEQTRNIYYIAHTNMTEAPNELYWTYKYTIRAYVCE